MAYLVAKVAEKTGWSRERILWQEPYSVILQMIDVWDWQAGAKLRYVSDEGVDIDAILDGTKND